MSSTNEQYNEYNRVLRAWFVAFGFGGPAIFLVNPEVRNQLVEQSEMQTVVVYFLSGAVAQIVVAFLNKVVNWYSIDDGDAEYMKTLRYRISSAVVEWFWIDLVADLFTFLVFGLGIWKVFMAFSG